MSSEAQENDQPNDEGFAGDPTTPEPDRGSTGENLGESIAVPAGDLTGALVHAIEETTSGKDDQG
jgi:hypothetical protein